MTVQGAPRHPSRPSRRRAVGLVLGVPTVAWLFVVMLGGTGGAAAPSDHAAPAALSPSATASSNPAPAASPPVDEPGTIPVPTAGDPLERGRLLYGGNCASCHGQRGEGSQRGPDLRSVGSASTDFQLRTGRMPIAAPEDQPRSGPPSFSSPDIKALVAYVDSLGDGNGPRIPQVLVGEPQRGRRLYLTNCAACHSSSGVGAVLTAGHVAPNLLGTAHTQLGEAVRVGPGVMPQFPREVLSDSDVGDIAAYVDSLDRERDHGGWPIGGVGPVTEGAVGWLVGLGIALLLARRLGKRAS